MINNKKIDVPLSKPEYVKLLEASYGAPSQAGFGSAVFYEQIGNAKEIEKVALQKYQFFVGDNWERFGEGAWMSTWKQVYTRAAGSKHQILAELRGITDPDAALSVPMILDVVENADAAKKALSTTYDV